MTSTSRVLLLPGALEMSDLAPGADVLFMQGQIMDNAYDKNIPGSKPAMNI